MTHTRTCQGCGREISAYAPRCIYCGKARPVRCPKCKELTFDGSTSCARCGAPLPDPARMAAALKTQQPAFQWEDATDQDEEQAPARERSAPSRTIERWKAILVIVSAVLVLLFVLQTVLISSQKRHKIHVTKEIHKLWDVARDLAGQGKTEEARKAYADAIAKMQYHSLDDPTLRAALEREMGELSPEPEPAQKPPQMTAGKEAVDSLKKKGYVLQAPLAFLVKPPGKGFYMQRLCVEAWVTVTNMGRKPVHVSRASFQAHVDGGSALPAADVYEAYHLSEKDIGPGESTSGAILFGVGKEEALSPDSVKEITYANKPVWTRTDGSHTAGGKKP